MAFPMLKGTAFLTGAGSGIGRATAIAFARSGIQNLALSDRNKASLSSVSDEIKSKYPNVKIDKIELDVGDTNGVENSVFETVKKFGRIDVAVNLAGIGGNGKMTHDNDETDWMKVVDINLNGVWRSQRAQLKVMMKQENLGERFGRGNIINVASMYGLVGPSPSIPSTQYTAAKHGVVGLTKADAISYAAHGIRLNAICPGYILTPLLGSAPQTGQMDGELEKVPMRRFGTTEEIADCITFLASPWSSFMTGSNLVVDGGYTSN